MFLSSESSFLASDMSSSSYPSIVPPSFLHIFANGAGFGHAASQMILREASQAISERGRFTIALSGGSMASQLSAGLREAAGSHPFDQWHIFLADERYVPLDHADSNYALIKTHLLSHIPQLRDDQVHKLQLGDSVEHAARLYEDDLKQFFSTSSSSSSSNEAIPEFDIIMLGMGPDGHTASLFPGHALLQHRSSLIASISDSPKPPPQRITMTLPLIQAARHIIFMAGGAEKASVLKQIFASSSPAVQSAVAASPHDPPPVYYPAALVHHTVRHIDWFVDAAAWPSQESESTSDSTVIPSSSPSAAVSSSL